jgi:hypothetical protein
VSTAFMGEEASARGAGGAPGPLEGGHVWLCREHARNRARAALSTAAAESATRGEGPRRVSGLGHIGDRPDMSHQADRVG